MFSLARTSQRLVATTARRSLMTSAIRSNAESNKTNVYPHALNSTSNPAIVPADSFAEQRLRDDEQSLRDHHNSALTTSHPSPEIIAADVLSDAPPALHYRTVRIYQPTKTTMQSGKFGTNHWRIDFDVLQGSGRWENALMGWGSSADYMQGTTMKFKTKEEAIHFAEKQGWDYQVDVAHQPRIPPKSYSENYVHVSGKLRIHKTK